MEFKNNNPEAANQFDALRYHEVRDTYDLESNSMELERLRHKLKRMTEIAIDEMPNLNSVSFAKAGEDKYLYEEVAQKVKILEAIVAEQMQEEEKEAA